MAHYYRQRGPVLGLTINTEVQSLGPKEKVEFTSFLFKKVKIFFSVFRHYDSLFLFSIFSSQIIEDLLILLLLGNFLL